MGTKTAKHPVGTRREWLKARLNLLKEEKAHTRRGDELSLKRQALPWVRVEKKYEFATGVEYNFRRQPPMNAESARQRPVAASHAAMCGVDWGTYLREMPGMSS